MVFANTGRRFAAKRKVNMIPEVPGILEDMLALHKEKSKGYGSDHDPAHNFTAVASISGEKKFYYPMLRIGEKLTRALNLYEAKRFSDLHEELRDIALIAVIAEALLMQDDLKLMGEAMGEAVALYREQCPPLTEATDKAERDFITKTRSFNEQLSQTRKHKEETK